MCGYWNVLPLPQGRGRCLTALALDQCPHIDALKQSAEETGTVSGTVTRNLLTLTGPVAHRLVSPAFTAFTRIGRCPVRYHAHRITRYPNYSPVKQSQLSAESFRLYGLYIAGSPNFPVAGVASLRPRRGLVRLASYMIAGMPLMRHWRAPCNACVSYRLPRRCSGAIAFLPAQVAIPVTSSALALRPAYSPVLRSGPTVLLYYRVAMVPILPEPLPLVNRFVC